MPMILSVASAENPGNSSLIASSFLISIYATNSRITSYNVCYTKLLREDSMEGETMTKPFQKAMLITSIVYLVIGLILIIWPDAARQILIYAIGAAALLYGGYRIVDFFVRKEHLSGTVQLGVALGIGCP